MKIKSKKPLIMGLIMLLILSSVPISLMFSAAENNGVIGLLSDGGFENGTTLFGTFSGRKQSDTAFEGKYIVNCTGKICSKAVKLESGLKYKLSFWYLNPTAEETDLFGVTSDISTALTNRRVDYYVSLCETKEWQYSSLEFTANKTDYMLYIDGTVQIDAVTLEVKKPDGIIENGSFEEGFKGWSSNTTDEIVKTGNASNGFIYASLPIKKNGGIYYDFNVNRSTDYLLSFDYSGGGTNSAFAVTKTSGNVTLEDTVSEVKGFASSSVWTNTSLSFNSGNNTRLRIFVRSGEYGTLAVDNFKIKISDTSNKVLNGEFTSNTDNWTVTGTAPEFSDIISAGGNSLKFAASDGTIYQRITVEKNKAYKLTFNRLGNVSFAVCKGTLSAPVFGGEDVIIGNSFYDNNMLFKAESYEFNSGDNESVLIAFKGKTAAYKTVIDDVFIYENIGFPEKPVIFENGSFNEGLTGWEQRWENGTGFEITGDEEKGERALLVTGGSYNKIGRPFSVEAGKSYKVVFNYSGTLLYNKWSVTSGGYTNRFNTDEGTSGYIVGGMITRDSLTAYQTAVSDTFTVTANDTYYFNIASNMSTGMSALFDDIYVFEASENESSLIVNNDFEYPLEPWWSTSSAERETEGYNSYTSLKIPSDVNSVISQRIYVEADANYELSFMYRGNPSKISAAFAVSADTSFSVASALAKGKLTKSDEWKRASLVVNSGNNTSLYVLFKASKGYEYSIDNVIFTKTDKTATAVGSLKPANFGKLLGGNSKISYVYITTPTYNVVQNGDFEGTQSGSKPDAMKIEGGGSTETLNENGGKALKFEAGNNGAAAAIPLKLDKNTEYYMTLSVKSPKITKTNLCDVTFGIADGDTGDYIISAEPELEQNLLWTDEKQLIPTAADGKWHIVTMSFVTNDSDNLVFMINGKNSALYIDDLYIFKPAYKVKWQSKLDKLKDVTVTNTSPTLLGTKTNEDNIVKNFDFESADLSDWSKINGSVYGDTLHIEDTKSDTYEKAFHYAANKRYPHNIYYIKWVDIEPDTEYTFSAICSVVKPGGGYFGLISGHKVDTEISALNENLLYPSVIKQFDFSETNYKENCEWQTVGVSFNSKDRNRVGIVVFDGGGEAFIDNIRLFKTSAAASLPAVSDDFPKTLVASGIDLQSGKITLTEEKKLINLLLKFENPRYLRVFDIDGNEIEDTSAYAADGMEIRLMDGPVIKDKATVVLYGDVNRDGRRNVKDLVRIKKAISKLLNEPNMDINQDGEIDSVDLAELKTIILR